MSTDYRPGTVALATVRGTEDVRVMAGYGTAEPRLRWMTTDARLMDERNEGWFMAYQVTDVRPLVVLDLKHPDAMLQTLREAAHAMDAYAAPLTNIADQIEEQTKSSIPEPGLWGVVEAEAKGITGNVTTARKRWVRDEQGWIEVAGNGWRVSDFSYLVAPVLVREGVTE